MNRKTNNSNKTNNTNSADKTKKPNKAKNQPSITEAMASIRRIYENADIPGSKVVFEKPERYSLSAGTMKVFDKSRLADYHRMMSEWNEEGRIGKKPSEPAPERTYVFYPSSVDSRSLGSVSIYGPDVVRVYVQIRLRGFLFGLRVRKVSVEQGQRPFLDVIFRP